MRTYYIFNINKEMSILTKDSPYMLFKFLESINRKSNDLYTASNLYEQIAKRFNKVIINDKIYNKYKDNEYYIHSNDYHSYYNKYRDERCNITVKNSYLICNSNNSRLELLNSLNDYNLFVCDFENKDYFWLNEIYC